MFCSIFVFAYEFRRLCFYINISLKSYAIGFEVQYDVLTIINSSVKR